MTETIVRLATRADETQMFDLCKALHAENGLFAMNDDAVHEMLNRAFDKKGGIIGVIDGDGGIAGAIYMLISRFWYSQDNHLEELFSFIRPQSRKSNYATDLVSFAKRCADSTGLRLLIGILTNKDMELKVRLYRRRLGMPAGAFFVYDPKEPHNKVATSFETWRSIADDSPVVPKGARVVTADVLSDIGRGDAEAGRAAIDKFITSETRRYQKSKNGLSSAIIPQLPSAVSTTQPLPLLALNG